MNEIGRRIVALEATVAALAARVLELEAQLKQRETLKLRKDRG